MIKIDVEGFEYEVLRGLKENLITHSPKILLELHLTYLENRSISADEILNSLLSYGYKLYDLDKKEISAQKLINSFDPTVHLIAIKSK